MKKHSWIAAVLSLLAVGLGQVFNTQYKKAAFFFALGLISLLIKGHFLFQSFLAVLLFVLVNCIVLIFTMRDAWIHAKTTSTNTRLPWYILLLIACGMLGFYAATKTYATRYDTLQVTSSTSLPTLFTGDLIYIDKWAYKKSFPQRGDLIAFAPPSNTQVYYVMRVIGLPNEKIESRGAEVLINNIPLSRVAKKTSDILGLSEQFQTSYPQSQFTVDQESSESRVYFISYDLDITHWNLDSLLIPNKSYFVMGDNRSYSNDSRVWGVLPETNILGTAVQIYMSYQKEFPFIRWERIGKKLTPETSI